MTPIRLTRFPRDCLCDGVEVADECPGSFEKESICFGFDLFSGFVKIGHGRYLRKEGKQNILAYST